MRLLVAMSLLSSAALAQQIPPAASPGGDSSFWQRWAAAYSADWRPSANGDAATAPPRRGAPQPLDSPPFPSSDWSYGGSPTIGEPDTQTYPLMSGLGKTTTRIKLYGWVDPSVNASTSTHTNAPDSNDYYPNRAELNQFVVYLERLPDTVQQQHFDWGFHLTSLFGTDYRYTTDKGYFSSQLIKDGRQYGFDPSLEYIDLYFPHAAQGLNLRLGRFISIPGIEAQLAPYNYMFTHSLLYSVDPFTDTGILATIKLSDKWLLQGGLTAGHDIAPWVSGAKPSGTACVDYTSKSVRDNFYACANGINSGKYAYNNVQQYDLTWYHRFSKTWHTASETYYMYERDVPATSGPTKPEPGTNGALCRLGQLRCTAPEYAVQNYVQHELGAHDYLSFRTDYLDDKKGQRTGYATRYSENTLSWVHWFGTTVQLRPELRFGHAWDRRSYNDGRAVNQFVAASDLVFHF